MKESENMMNNADPLEIFCAFLGIQSIEFEKEETQLKYLSEAQLFKVQIDEDWKILKYNKGYLLLVKNLELKEWHLRDHQCQCYHHFYN